MYSLKINDKKEYSIEFDNGDTSHGTINGKPFDWDVIRLENDNGSYHIIRDLQSYNISVQETDMAEKKFVITVRGNAYNIKLSDQYDILLKDLGLDQALSQKVDHIKAPMPGLVLSVDRKPGDVLKKGDSLLVLEAMKMENVIKSPVDGVVKSISIKQGEAVEKNQVMVTFE